MKNNELFNKELSIHSPEEFCETINKLSEAYLEAVDKLKESIEYSQNAKEYSEGLQREISLSRKKIENGIKKKMQTTVNDLQKIVDSVVCLESFAINSQSEEIIRTANNILEIIENIHERLKVMNLVDLDLEITGKLHSITQTKKKSKNSLKKKDQNEDITEKEITQPSLFSTEK